MQPTGDPAASSAVHVVPQARASVSTRSRMEMKLCNGRFILRSKLGSGSFGDIYKGIDTLNRNRDIAVKMEPVKSRHPQLQYESKVYKLLHSHPMEVVGFPFMYWYGSEEGYNAMAMELCGPCLEDLFNYCLRKFSLKTVLMIGEQMMHRIEFLHHKGLVHRDIKPENYVFGLGEKGHHLHMIDFGLSKRFTDGRTQEHIPFRDGKPLTGTARYCSCNTHRGYEQSRRDDLESIGFLLIYFMLGKLPWQGIDAPDAQAKTIKIGEKKIATPLEELCRDLPPEFHTYMKYCRGLKFPDVPDYNLLRSLFSSLMAQERCEMDWEFDWLIKRDGERRDAEHDDELEQVLDMTSEVHGMVGSNVSKLPVIFLNANPSPKE